MKNSYKEYKQLNLTETADDIRRFWEENGIFQKSLDNRSKDNAFVFFKGPPSANGTPGIHHRKGKARHEKAGRHIRQVDIDRERAA